MPLSIANNVTTTSTAITNLPAISVSGITDIEASAKVVPKSVGCTSVKDTIQSQDRLVSLACLQVHGLEAILAVICKLVVQHRVYDTRVHAKCQWGKWQLTVRGTQARQL